MNIIKLNAKNNISPNRKMYNINPKILEISEVIIFSIGKVRYIFEIFFEMIWVIKKILKPIQGRIIIAARNPNPIFAPSVGIYLPPRCKRTIVIERIKELNPIPNFNPLLVLFIGYLKFRLYLNFSINLT